MENMFDFKNMSDSELSEFITMAQQTLNSRKRKTFNKDVFVLVEAIRKFTETYPKAKFVVANEDGEEVDVFNIINSYGFSDLLNYFYLDD